MITVTIRSLSKKLKYAYEIQIKKWNSKIYLAPQVTSLHQSISSPAPHLEDGYRAVVPLLVKWKRALAPWVVRRKSMVATLSTQSRSGGVV